MRRSRALGLRRNRPINPPNIAGASLAALCLLASCGPSPAPPAPDPFQPTRPTSKGSITDAVRRAHGRSPSQPVRQLVAANRQPTPPAQLFEPEPPPDAAACRQHVLDYLNAIDSLLAELDGVLSGGRGDSLAVVAARCDAVRTSLDQLVSMPPESRLGLEAELGERIAVARDGLHQRLESLRRDDARRPIATLVADLPLLE